MEGSKMADGSPFRGMIIPVVIDGCQIIMTAGEYKGHMIQQRCKAEDRKDKETKKEEK